MKTLLSAVAASVVLSACGGGGSTAPATPLADASTDNPDDDCQTAYLREITGVYDGQIQFESGDNVCLWDVDLEVSARLIMEGFDSCSTHANITSTLISDDSGQCGDIAQAGDFSQPIDQDTELAAVSFPVDGFVLLNSLTPDTLVYPVGTSASTRFIDVSLDGRGNMTLPGSFEFTGVLVKQF